MNRIEQRYMRAIRSRVCRTCVNLRGDRTCGLPAAHPCPVERNLREILQIVHHAESEQVQPYLDRLRGILCATCDQADSAGYCALRASDSCPLDRYFVLVIEAIEEVRDRIRAEAHGLAVR